MGVGVARALGTQPLILTGTRQHQLEMGKRLGADEVVNVNIEDPVEAVQRLTRGMSVQYVLESSGARNALNEAARMVNRGGRIYLAAFPADAALVDLAYPVRNNIYVFGIRGEGNAAEPGGVQFLIRSDGNLAVIECGRRLATQRDSVVADDVNAHGWVLLIDPAAVPPVTPLTLSSPTKATLFRIILWRCWAQSSMELLSRKRRPAHHILLLHCPSKRSALDAV
jgi:Zinc-binding dehydrogenase